MIRRSLLLMMVAMLSSNAVVSAGTKSPTQVDIGYPSSPNPTGTSCLYPLTHAGITTTLFYNSALQPAIAVNPSKPSNIVAVWQQDCTANNSAFIVGENWPAMEIGIGYSSDGGSTWKRTLVPFQNCNGGFIQGVGQSSLDYSSNGKKVYLITKCQNISTDASDPQQSGITATVSGDNGKTWSTPNWITAVADPACSTPSVKASLTEKNRAYIVYESNDQILSSTIKLSKTTNAGDSWSTPTSIYDPNADLNVTSARAMSPSIIELQNGDLLCFMHRYFRESSTNFLFDVAYVRSTDKGATWETQATHVADLTLSQTFTCGVTNSAQRCYTQAIMQGYKVAVNPNNDNLYVVFPAKFDNGLPQIGLSVSCNKGSTWSAPVQVNRTPVNAPNPQAFTASVAVNDSGRVAVLYHDFRNSPAACVAGNTATDTWLAVYKETSGCRGGSTGVGLNFVSEARLSKSSYVMENGPNYSYIGNTYATNGDYNNLVANKDDFYAAYVQSLSGPFSPAQTILSNLPSTGVLVLDNNRRSAPFFSRVSGN